jgi:hypothetical protein
MGKTMSATSLPYVYQKKKPEEDECAERRKLCLGVRLLSVYALFRMYIMYQARERTLCWQCEHISRGTFYVKRMMSENIGLKSHTNRLTMAEQGRIPVSSPGKLWQPS